MSGLCSYHHNTWNLALCCAILLLSSVSSILLCFMSRRCAAKSHQTGVWFCIVILVIFLKLGKHQVEFPELFHRVLKFRDDARQYHDKFLKCVTMKLEQSMRDCWPPWLQRLKKRMKKLIGPAEIIASGYTYTYIYIFSFLLLCFLVMNIQPNECNKPLIYNVKKTNL